MAAGSTLHWVDYVVIIGYFALVIAVGIISSLKVLFILNFQRFSASPYYIFVNIFITPIAIVLYRIQ